MTTAGFLAYALALGVAAAIPGPGVVALVARALASGFWAGMAFATSACSASPRMGSWLPAI